MIEGAIEVVEAKRHHCGAMARRMRKAHRDILASGGIDAHRELVMMFGQSSFRRSVFSKGKIVAMGGSREAGSPRTASHGWFWRRNSETIPSRLSDMHSDC